MSVACPYEYDCPKCPGIFSLPTVERLEHFIAKHKADHAKKALPPSRS